MPHEEPLYPADWLRIAEKDLRRVEILLEVQDAGAAGFFLQQAVEKFLKAFLLSRGWQLQRIHDLEVLLNASITYDPSLERFRAACEKITGFYFVERYPLITDTGLTDDDVESSLKQVRTLIDKLRTEVHGSA
ncbi:MAG: HEPN domain-containing protein [Candidatus Poribacteria bacterium]|nr:HEPN domain-containing protein [Candidatus Poribacteria bacterium]